MILVRLDSGKLVCYYCLQEILNKLTSLMGGALLARRSVSNLKKIAQMTIGLMNMFLNDFQCTHYAEHYLDY